MEAWDLATDLQSLDALEDHQVVLGCRHGLDLDICSVRDEDLQHQPSYTSLPLDNTTNLVFDICQY